MKNLLSLVFVFIGLSVGTVVAQQVTVDLYYENPSEAIGDGTVHAFVSGGVAPYQYQWSNAGTPLHSSSTGGIAEGIEFSLTIIDAKGTETSFPPEDFVGGEIPGLRMFALTPKEVIDSVQTTSWDYQDSEHEEYVTDSLTGLVDTIMVPHTDSTEVQGAWTYMTHDTIAVSSVDGMIIPNTSTSEGINMVFTPIVAAMGQVLFWDPFDATGIRPAVINIDSISLTAPLWGDDGMANMKVSKWLITSGDVVEHNQMIAEITSDAGTSYLYAVGGGTVNILVNEGGDVRKSEEVTEKVKGTDTTYTAVSGAALCSIDYAEPFPIMQPNGTPQSNSIPIVVVWLVLGAIFFTIKMRFINLRGFKHAFDLVRGKYDDPNDKGEVSHFQALTTALSATVGLGNIAGVAIAVSVGGAGATFWMIIAGLLGMASKFVECTLGVKYREISEDGEVSGGPMYYLSKGLAKRNMGGLGKVLAVIFAILCVGGSLGGGNMFQANQAFDQVSSAFPALQGQGFWFGIVLAVLVGVVIIGGIKSIARVTDKIVPFMVGIYVLFALIIIGVNITSIGDAFGSIISGAFSADAMKGGVIGVLIIGFQRAAFSNEAGVGSASIAHSASKTSEPVSEGIVALLEPFIDTVVVCTMTALVLIFTGYTGNTEGLGGATLTSEAFSSVFPWFKWVLMVAILLFAFSTMVSWSYYGQKAWSYMFGPRKVWGYLYKFIFLVFVVIGSTVGLGAVLDFSDLMILGMAFPNILGLILMSGEVRADMVSYFSRIKSGVIKKHK
jgi:AGCS family alanine or glycine:cation symporter